MIFQASDLESTHFLDLLDDELHTIELLYIKGGPQIKQFSHLNSLCTRVTRAIINHTPISEYHLRFFLRENFSCLCKVYLIETRHHILYECQRYNKLSQTSFSLYFHNQQTDFHKPSCTRKPQMRAICIYVECTKVTINNQDIRSSVAVKALSADIS